MIGALLVIMLILAVLFYFVNFPTTGRSIKRKYLQWGEWIATKRTQRYGYGYEELDTEQIEQDSNCGRSASTSSALRQFSMMSTSGSVGKEDTAAGFTTSANTPALHNTPTLYSRRRKVENMSPDSGTVAGLGINLGEAHSLRQQKSFDESLLRPDIDKPLPKPPASPVRQAVQSAKAFVSSPSNKPHSTTSVTRKGSADLESGLLKPSGERRRPAPSPVGPAPPSPEMRVLEMVGGSVEYAAEKMSKFMHDQVKGSPEEGLLLPVRDCEREKVVGEVYGDSGRGSQSLE